MLGNKIKVLENRKEIVEPPLEKLGRFLTDERYIVNPAIGRDKEIALLETVLVTPETSAVLVGEAGVGKTAIVEGLAYRIITGKVPKCLKSSRIFSITSSSLINGCKYIGEIEARFNHFIDEILSIDNRDIIVFMDEMHTVIGAGAYEGSNMDIADMLKPYLARGEIKMIGATTREEYEKHVLTDSAFKRRFEKITVYEPDEQTTIDILIATIKKWEQKTGVIFSFDGEHKKNIIEMIVKSTSENFRVDDSYNPALALSILKKSFAFALLDDSPVIKIDHFVSAVNSCEGIVKEKRQLDSDKVLQYMRGTYKKQ
jgi:ATP-dependent Clp protease ATP-binding subunit ClpA